MARFIAPTLWAAISSILMVIGGLNGIAPFGMIALSVFATALLLDGRRGI